jgi:3',5'-cyclic AMP phosphodiesterase CpdA
VPVVVVQAIDSSAIVVLQPASPTVVTVAPGGGTGGGGGGGAGTGYPALTLTTTSTDLTLAGGTHDVVLVDASGANRTITLPAAASNNNVVFTVKKIDTSSNTVTVDANGAETIDGQLNVVLTDQWEAVEFACNGSGWFLL